MSFTPTPSLAETVKPSDYPYRFTELVAFRGDFDQIVRPGEVVNPKGIAYHRALDRLIVSLSPYNVAAEDAKQILNAVARDGSRTRFAPSFNMFRRIESKITIVPESGPPVIAGFKPGEIFVGRGPQTEISRLSSGGEVISEVFAQFGEGGGFWGGLCFDTEGDFDGRLIAVDAYGKIYLIGPNGSSVLLIDLVKRLEGVAVAPTTFGPHAKNIIVGVEGYSDDDPNGGEIYAIGKDRVVTLLANIGFATENVQFIPPMSGTYYQTQLAFDRERENRIISISSSQFLNRLGHLIAVNEMTGELWEVAWNGSRYTQQQVGRAPGRWSTSGFYIQGTELEAGCFAVKSPRIPQWSDWQTVPGGFKIDRAPAAATCLWGDLVLLGKNMNDHRIYLNRLPRQPLPTNATGPSDPGRPQEWQGWQPELQPAVTPNALTCGLHNNRVYTFAVQTDGKIVHKFYTDFADEQSVQPWEEVPGGMLTNTGVGCATVNGRLVLCAIGQDHTILLNELAPGGRYWGGWYPIPQGGRADLTPAVASFQDELYIFIKDPLSNRVLLKTRTVDGDWAPWAEAPGGGLTDAPIVTATNEGQLYVFVKGLNQNVWVNLVSETGSWSGWSELPNSRPTNPSMAVTTIGNRIYLFATGLNDRQVYLRTTI